MTARVALLSLVGVLEVGSAGGVVGQEPPIPYIATTNKTSSARQFAGPIGVLSITDTVDCLTTAEHAAVRKECSYGGNLDEKNTGTTLRYLHFLRNGPRQLVLNFPRNRLIGVEDFERHAQRGVCDADAIDMRHFNYHGGGSLSGRRRFGVAASTVWRPNGHEIFRASRKINSPEPNLWAMGNSKFSPYLVERLAGRCSLLLHGGKLALHDSYLRGGVDIGPRNHFTGRLPKLERVERQKPGNDQQPNSRQHNQGLVVLLKKDSPAPAGYDHEAENGGTFLRGLLAMVFLFLAGAVLNGAGRADKERTHNDEERQKYQ